MKKLAEVDPWAQRSLKFFNRLKNKVKIISSNGRICYIPLGLKSDLDYVNRMAEDMKEIKDIQINYPRIYRT
ncbi:MAG: hypothetical protein AABW83_04030 [Nanoarchaeota archaeon]